jgi:hypothetical protein
MVLKKGMVTAELKSGRMKRTMLMKRAIRNSRLSLFLAEMPWLFPAVSF